MSRLLAPVLGGLMLFCGAARLPAQELNWAEKMFDKLNHDFGVVARGADTRYRFTITNKYVETIRIKEIRKTCGCTDAKLGENAVQNGNSLRSRESTTIEVAMDTRKFTHEKNSSIIVVFDQPIYQEVTVPIKAYIRTDVVVTPGSVEFGSVPKGQSAERKISVAYAGRDNWTIKEVISKNPNIDVKLAEKGRSAGRVDYELTVSLKPDVALGELRDQIQLVTDDASNPYVPVMVEGRVETEFTVNPDVLAFGTLAPGEKKTVNVVVRGRKPFTIDKIESDKTVGMFQVRLPPEAKMVHVLPITVTAPADATSLDDVFSITIGGNAEAVTFKATGKVTGPATTQVKTPVPTPQ